MATSGSATRGIVGMAVGTHTAWAPAGFMSTACGFGTRWPAHSDVDAGYHDSTLAARVSIKRPCRLSAHVVV